MGDVIDGVELDDRGWPVRERSSLDTGSSEGASEMEDLFGRPESRPASRRRTPLARHKQPLNVPSAVIGAVSGGLVWLLLGTSAAPQSNVLRAGACLALAAVVWKVCTEDIKVGGVVALVCLGGAALSLLGPAGGTIAFLCIAVLVKAGWVA